MSFSPALRDAVSGEPVTFTNTLTEPAEELELRLPVVTDDAGRGRTSGAGALASGLTHNAQLRDSG